MAARGAGGEEHALSPIRSWLLFINCLGLSVVGPVGAALETGAGAYSTALGNAFSAGVESAEGVWFNPATSARLRLPRVAITQGALYSGLSDRPSISAAAGVWPRRWGTLQAGFSGLWADDWAESQWLLGYGRVLHPRLSVGAQLRTASWSSGRYGQRRWLATVGALYEAGWVSSRSYVRFSAVVANIGRPDSKSARASGMPARSHTLGMQVRNATRALLLDLVEQGGDWQARCGYESVLRAELKLRLGATVLRGDTVNKTGHIGLGYEWKNVHFDYAFSRSYDLNDFGADHRFGIGYAW